MSHFRQPDSWELNYVATGRAINEGLLGAWATEGGDSAADLTNAAGFSAAQANASPTIEATVDGLVGVTSGNGSNRWTATSASSSIVLSTGVTMIWIGRVLSDTGFTQPVMEWGYSATNNDFMGIRFETGPAATLARVRAAATNYDISMHTPTYPDDVRCIGFSLTASGGTAEAWLDGVSQGTASPGAFTNTPDTFYLHARAQGAQADRSPDGRLIAAYLFNRVLTDIEHYMINQDYWLPFRRVHQPVIARVPAAVTGPPLGSLALMGVGR